LKFLIVASVSLTLGPLILAFDDFILHFVVGVPHQKNKAQAATDWISTLVTKIGMIVQ
jgi:hypothetical protein